MAVTVLGTRMFFGIVDDKPTLPDGWRYIEREKEWLLVESPEGETWFVDQDRIILRRTATWIDWIRTLPNYFRGYRPLKPGQIFADTRHEAILLSQLEEA